MFILRVIFNVSLMENQFVKSLIRYVRRRRRSISKKIQYQNTKINYHKINFKWVSMLISYILTIGGLIGSILKTKYCPETTILMQWWWLDSFIAEHLVSCQTFVSSSMKNISRTKAKCLMFKNTFWLVKTQKTSNQNIGGEVIVQYNKILKHTRKHTGIQAKLYQKLLYESPACNFSILCFSEANFYAFQ